MQQLLSDIHYFIERSLDDQMVNVLSKLPYFIMANSGYSIEMLEEFYGGMNTPLGLRLTLVHVNKRQIFIHLYWSTISATSI